MQVTPRLITVLCVGLLLLSFIPLVSSGTENGSNDGDYYFAYGDSITRAKESNYPGGGDWTDAYMYRMVELYEKNGSRTEDHMNSDADGNRGSYPVGYAWQNGQSQYFYDWDPGDGGNAYFIYMLGVNDCAIRYGYWTSGYSQYYPPNEDYTPKYLVKGLLKIYNESLENGTIPVLCHPTCMDNSYADKMNRYPGLHYENYSVYYNITFSKLKNFSIRCVPMWDSMDTNPWDGRLQNWSWNLYEGHGVHPNADGHDAMAYMLWYFLQGWDYNETYYEGNNTLVVDANYNETIFINNTYFGWDTNNLTITCLSNSTVIPHSIQTAFNGSQMIRFDIVDGSSYLLGDGTGNGPEFVSINTQGNNTIVYTGERTFNWTKQPGAIQYHLQIANDSGFADIFVNLSDINEINYGVNYDTKGDYIEFILPDAYEISWTGHHYYRVRARH